MAQQTTLDGYNIGVQQVNPDIRALVLTEVNPPSGNTIVLPLPNEIADKIGRELQGSSVQIAPATALRALK